ncbi:MAG: hypothetical protein PVG82_06580 [Chromatiales bacterium]
MGMFGLFGKKKRYAELSEKARRLAQEQIREIREARRIEQGLAFAFRERSRQDRRSGRERRRFRIDTELTERRLGGERRVALDRRGAMAVAPEQDFPGRLRSRESVQERELRLEHDAMNTIRRDIERS